METEKYLAPIAQQILGSQSVLSSIQISNIPSNVAGWRKFHIDGQNHVMVSGKSIDGVPWFKIIFGIFLTKTRKDTGELFISPKGHWQVQEFFKQNSSRFWKDGVLVADSKEVYQELVKSISVSMTPVYADPGDVILFHCMMPHSIGDNLGNDRHVAYFRYGAYREPGEKALTSMWQGFEGLDESSIRAICASGLS